MQPVTAARLTYITETHRLNALPPSTEASFYPDLKLLRSAIL
jgi:hypothetical protein